MTVFTIGHSRRAVEELARLLGEQSVDLVIDVRSFPRSRANPQFNAGALRAALAAFGIGYRHLRALGGRRGPQRLDGPSPNGMWRNAGFRNYADYAMTPESHAGLDALRELARAHTCAIMCAEAVWWRCHRQIIADYLLASGFDVDHIVGPGRLEAARLTPGAQVQADGALHYPGEQGMLI